MKPSQRLSMLSTAFATIVKNHPFTDGNKRIGSLLFLLYLNQDGVTHRLNPQALTALTLLSR